MTVKTKEWERTIEEIEERYIRTQDENEDLRRKITNLERSLHELRQHAGDHDKREQRQVEQYERVIEGLRADLREKERELSNVELRETFAKQDLAQTLRQEQESVKKLNEDLKLQKLMESRLSEEATVMKQELATLKGSLEESDRTREMLMRELTR